MLAKILAISSTLALLVWMGFFLMGSLPLMVLKHDTPLDGRFIRGLFNVYYGAVLATAAIAAVGHALSARPAIALAMLGIAALSVLSRHWMLAQMDRARNSILMEDPAAIWQFRRLHIGGMLLNVVQLAIICVGMTKLDFV